MIRHIFWFLASFQGTLINITFSKQTLAFNSRKHHKKPSLQCIFIVNYLSHQNHCEMGFSLLFFLLISLRPTVSVDGNLDLIQKTCKSTKYYELCLSSLKSDSTSPKADTKDLARVMIRIGKDNATATNSYLSSQMLSTTNNTLMKKIIKECADKYASASEALYNAVQDLGAELYDYAYMHVMAAADYPNSCHNAFKRYPGLICNKRRWLEANLWCCFGDYWYSWLVAGSISRPAIIIVFVFVNFRRDFDIFSEFSLLICVADSMNVNRRFIGFKNNFFEKHLHTFKFKCI